MAAMIENAKRLTFRDIARAALQANGLDADQVLKEFVAGLHSQTDAIHFGTMRPSSTLTVDHEGTTFEFKQRGSSVNFELVARIKPEEQWLEVAFLSDH